jgi:hypothetical protein
MNSGMGDENVQITRMGNEHRTKEGRREWYERDKETKEIMKYE